MRSARHHPTRLAALTGHLAAPGLRLAVLAASIGLAAGPDVQLLPAGKFSSRDGRPGPGLTWSITDDEGRRLAAEMTAACAGRAEFLIDYDHQTLHAEKNGREAPAAGWASRFEWRDGQGLFALSVQWTAAAQARINALEYRYISPVLTYDDAGRVTGVLMAAITNYPGLTGLQPLGAAAALQAALDRHNAAETPPMNELLKKLLARLGLDETTDEAAALSAMDALISAQKPARIPAVLAYELSVKTDDDPSVAVTALSAKVRKAAEPHLQTIAVLQGQLAALQARDVERTIDEAMKAGRLVPALREWALDLGRSNPAAMQALIEKSPVLPLGPQSGGRDPHQQHQQHQVAALSGDGLTVAQSFGINPTDFQKRLAESGAGA